mgnify:CR=1 FL=1
MGAPGVDLLDSAARYHDAQALLPQAAQLPTLREILDSPDREALLAWVREVVDAVVDRPAVPAAG